MLYPPCLANRPAIHVPRPPHPMSPRSIFEFASAALTNCRFNRVMDTAEAPALARKRRRVNVEPWSDAVFVRLTVPCIAQIILLSNGRKSRPVLHSLSTREPSPPGNFVHWL